MVTTDRFGDVIIIRVGSRIGQVIMLLLAERSDQIAVCDLNEGGGSATS